MINLELSPWLIPLCLLISGGLSYVLYSKSSPWGIVTNRILSGIRFIVFFFLSMLLLNPLLKQFNQDIEKPVAVIAIDNSESMRSGMDSMQIAGLLADVRQLIITLEEKGYEVDIQSLSGKENDLKDIPFNEKTSNLNAWLDQLQADNEGLNMTRMFLISDGIYNQGVSPDFFPHNFILNAIGVGDTLQKSDLVLKNVFSNKVAYQGNRFPVLAEVVNYGFSGEKTEIQLWQEGKVVDSKPLKFIKEQALQTVQLEADAEKEGYQRLSIVIRSLANESTIENNRRNVYVDVVDGKQKILLLAPAPHPDLKTLAAVIAQNDNYELKLFIPGVSKYKKEKYDLVISHESYDRWNRCEKYLNELKKEGIPVFHIIGKASRLNKVNVNEPQISIIQQRNQRDNVLGAINKDFKKFSLQDVSNKNLSSFPPLNVPYGNYAYSTNADVLLYQKVGSVTTDKPLLLLVEENNLKSGFLLADGFWKWRMQEFAMNGNSETFDEMFMKVIQYLSTKVDKRKFRFSPTKNEYYTNEIVQFQAELYNDLYERVFNEEVKISITDEENVSHEASFVPASSYANFEFTAIKEGTYRYEASTVLDGKKERVNGVFVLKEFQLERIDQVAKFGMLRQLADNSGGEFYKVSDFENILNDVESANDASLIHTEEKILSIINLKWILFIFVLMISIEWLARKYNGGY
ncbi:MAG: hypothetical protein JXR07_12170 [Reichenbachiella sp.]